MTTTKPAALTLEWLDRTRQQLLLSSPFYVLVPGLFFVAFMAMGHTPSWLMMGAGALGWIVAAMLRGPVAIVAQKLTGTPEKATPWVIASSGPLEEGLRVLAVLWLGRDLPTALAIGLGWGAIESVFAIVNSLVANVMLRSDDPKIVEAREMLAHQMNTDNGPWWGVLERISATAYHTGKTLILAVAPWAVLIAAPMHSAVNMLSVRIAKRSALQMEALVAVVGALALGLGFFLFLA
jgi:hypothetical protein